MSFYSIHILYPFPYISPLIYLENILPYNPSKFRISKYYVGQDDRRFKKMGYIGMLKLVIQNYLHRNDIEHYRKDVKYWD